MNSNNLHIAIIMDGNGRWAAKRGLPRRLGHCAGAKTVRAIVEAAAKLGTEVLSLYAFSSDNWLRPPDEVRNLMTLLRRYLLSEVTQCHKHGIRISVIGRRDRLDPDLISVIEAVEAQTGTCKGMNLRLAVDYSATHAIASTAIDYKIQSLKEFSKALGETIHSPSNLKPVDILIRTGGEQRLSDFLLWECAYAELIFMSTLWPDFTKSDLLWALSEYTQRDRRFGRIPQQSTG